MRRSSCDPRLIAHLTSQSALTSTAQPSFVSSVFPLSWFTRLVMLGFPWTHRPSIQRASAFWPFGMSTNVRFSRARQAATGREAPVGRDQHETPLTDASTKTTGCVTPWNKGKLLGQKPQLKEILGYPDSVAAGSSNPGTRLVQSCRRQQIARLRSCRAPRP